jgi:hypothetical protein
MMTEHESAVAYIVKAMREAEMEASRSIEHANNQPVEVQAARREALQQWIARYDKPQVATS